MNERTEYCNWSFDEFISSGKWLVKRDCEAEPITLSRGDSRNWKAYEESLKPRYTDQPPLNSSKCPKCHKYVNGVNPYDNGETWRR